MAIRSDGARRTKRFAHGDRRALPPDLVGRIEPPLNALDRADSLSDLDLPGARLHELKGDRKGSRPRSASAAVLPGRCPAAAARRPRSRGCARGSVARPCAARAIRRAGRVGRRVHSGRLQNSLFGRDYRLD